MDNICHSLTGAALAKAGLDRWTRFGTATLVVAANLPDVDVLAFLSDTPSVALRRGWTHGVLAQALLPVLLAAAVLLIDRLRPPRAPDARPARPWALLALGYVGVLSHVGMDWLNTYGVRVLMPYSARWFYGDAVFIVDPWLWLTLGAGALLAKRRRSAAPALVAVCLAAAYIGGMIASAAAARERVSEQWTGRTGHAPSALMVGPVPVNPLRKTVIVDAGTFYERGSFDWRSGELVLAPARVPNNADHPAVARAREHPDFKAILVWARFPYYEITASPGGTSVRLADMRFGDRSLFTATAVVPDE